MKDQIESLDGACKSGEETRAIQVEEVGSC